jgi:hypothetical protein
MIVITLEINPAEHCPSHRLRKPTFLRSWRKETAPLYSQLISSCIFLAADARLALCRALCLPRRRRISYPRTSLLPPSSYGRLGVPFVDARCPQIEGHPSYPPYVSKLPRTLPPWPCAAPRCPVFRTATVTPFILHRAAREPRRDQGNGLHRQTSDMENSIHQPHRSFNQDLLVSLSPQMWTCWSRSLSEEHFLCFQDTVVLRVEADVDVGVLKLVQVCIPYELHNCQAWLLIHEVHINCTCLKSVNSTCSDKHMVLARIIYFGKQVQFLTSYYDCNCVIKFLFYQILCRTQGEYRAEHQVIIPKHWSTIEW